MDTRPYERYISLDQLRTFWEPMTNWRLESLARAMLTSLELSFLLVRHTLADPRSLARVEQRVERMLALIHRQLFLLSHHLPEIPDEVAALQPSDATNLLRCNKGSAAIAPRIDYWTRIWLAHLVQNDWHLGIEPCINDLRVLYGLAPVAIDWGKPVLAYDRLAQPSQLIPLIEEHTFNPEDALFAGVHQITECWLYVVNRELQGSAQAARVGQLSLATGTIERTRDIVAYLTEHIQLLDAMVLADYHPLRVRLRDASGAQSAQVMEMVRHAKSLLPPVQEYLADRQASVLDVYAEPCQFPQEHAYLEAFASLEIAVASFFFHHYKLAARVLGAESLGSLGFEVQKLTSRFTAPFSPLLDQVRYDHVVITNFAYNEVAGTMTSQLEAAYGETPTPLAAHPTSATIAAEQAIKQVNAYFDALQRQSIEDWLRLFAPDAVLEDPEGSRPYYGYQGLRIYFLGYIKVLGQDLVIQVDPPRYCAESGVAHVTWTVQARYRTVLLQTNESAEIFFTPDGTICRVVVHQDHTMLADRLRSQLTYV
ncbi:MAG: hypothetical protein KatS3mg057_0122 [Herpetosiphonaceae bacterium]|nr:MAG: hypothetical protein KatS3mg057_0122 [Herpetosiphonaceae bacterium]